MIPYLEAPVVALGPLRIHAFTVIAACAALLGVEMAVRHARRFGAGRDDAAQLAVATLAGGVLGAHALALALAAYHAHDIAARPWMLVPLAGPLSSMGGLLGGLAAARLALRRTRGWRPPARGLDLLALGVAWGFALGRVGCALAHDHPGIRTDHWLAVRFPDGPRLDMGLLEIGFWLPAACLLTALARRPHPPGRLVALLLGSYAAVRFGLDFLREGEPRAAGLTPAQWACAALLAGALLQRTAARPARSTSR